MPAARVISSSLNYASTEVSSSVRIRQVQKEWIEKRCHKNLVKPCIPATNHVRLDGLEKE